jgi:hypothetical protein
MPVKRSADQRPDGADSVAKPRSAPDEPDRPDIRAHPMVSTEETLRRLPESLESTRYRSRVRKASSEGGGSGTLQSAGSVEKTRTPYDPLPVKQHDLDMLV